MKTRYFTVLLFFVFGSLAAQEAEITLEFSPKELAAGNKTQVTVSFILPEGYYQGLQENFFAFRLKETPGLSLEGPFYPPGKEKNGLILYEEAVSLTGFLSAAPTVSPGRYKIDFLADYQLCDETGLCLFPQSKAVSGELTIRPPDRLSGGIAGSFLLKMLFLAFIGGLLLNIMPCVLPVLSIKALSLAGQGKKDKKSLRIAGLAYTAGVIISLMVLALGAVLIKLSGEWAGWGFQFQNPRFVLALTGLIFLFALSLFEVFTIRAPQIRNKTGRPGKTAWAGSFGSGVFAVLLATPCTAPFLGTALGFAFSQPPLFIFLIFFFVGLGLSLPFLILGFFPGFIRAIPKPGPWMNRFREVMAFLLLATVIWLLSIYQRLAGGAGLVRALIFIFFLALAGWIYGAWGGPEKRKGLRISAGIFALILIGAAGFWTFSASPGDGKDQTAGPSVQTANLPAGWRAFDPQEVSLIRRQGRPVFLAFSAQWCLTCKTNEQGLLLSAWGDAFFEDQGIVRFYGDYTAGDGEIARWIRDFGRAGVPVYVYYPPGGEGVLLPEILSKKILQDSIIRP